MPYIITIAPRADHAPERNGDLDRESHDGCDICAQQRADTHRTAVATLDEARTSAREAVAGKPYDMINPANVALALPESGGTIGPLPDGTVIEVRPVTHQWLVGQIGFGQRNQMWFRNAAAVDVIAAFNQQA